jgi:hypothetical protein
MLQAKSSDWRPAHILGWVIARFAPDLRAPVIGQLVDRRRHAPLLMQDHERLRNQRSRVPANGPENQKETFPVTNNNDVCLTCQPRFIHFVKFKI